MSWSPREAPEMTDSLARANVARRQTCSSAIQVEAVGRGAVTATDAVDVALPDTQVNAVTRAVASRSSTVRLASQK